MPTFLFSFKGSYLLKIPLLLGLTENMEIVMIYGFVSFTKLCNFVWQFSPRLHVLHGFRSNVLLLLLLNNVQCGKGDGLHLNLLFQGYWSQTLTSIFMVVAYFDIVKSIVRIPWLLTWLCTVWRILNFWTMLLYHPQIFINKLF